MTYMFNLRVVALGIHKDSEAESHNLSTTGQGNVRTSDLRAYLVSKGSHALAESP
jgi:hypothetical protein